MLMVISTDGGLWRYIIGDTVEFTSLFPHKIKITGRTRHFINAFGEEVIIDNAEKALEKACLGHRCTYQSNIPPGRFTWAMTPKDHMNGSLNLTRILTDLDHFTEILDTTLKSVNSDYEAKTIQGPYPCKTDCKSCSAGTFYKWFKEKDKLGGQNKMPRLSNNREYH